MNFVPQRFALLVVFLSLTWCVEPLMAEPAVESGSGACVPARDIYVKHFGPRGVRVELRDHLKRAAFWWPRTLLSYPLVFDVPIKASQLVLRDEGTGELAPFQLSEEETSGGVLKFAVVNFFSDLPSGGTRSFSLTTSAVAKASGTSMRMEGTGACQCKESREAGTVVLNSGRLKVRIPESRVVPPAGAVPGPILAIARDGVWIGDSKIVSPRRPVKKITTERLESGSLFITYRVSYEFVNGGRYHATIRAIAGYDFVELSEEMHGLPKEEGIYVDQVWTGFHPTHRSSRGCPVEGTWKIDQAMVRNSMSENRSFAAPDAIEDPSREMFMKLRPSWPNVFGGNRSVSFWDEPSGAGLGVFIPDVSRWQDHEYSIGGSSDTLLLRFRYSGGVLHWTWPLSNGTRFTGISSDNHTSSSAVDDLERGGHDEDCVPVNQGMPLPKLTLPVFLGNRYGELGLNRVKDWVLEYPATARRQATVFTTGSQKDVGTYIAELNRCAVAAAADGVYDPVALRELRTWGIPDFNRLSTEMTDEQRESATAILLLSAYLSAEEEFTPLQNSLGGHPRSMADKMAPLLGVAFLFPDHPMAGEWRDRYEKFIELECLFNARPPVPQWEGRGGRWTESIADYNWAFIDAVVETNRFGLLDDGRNRIATPGFAMMADYLTGILTAPVKLKSTEGWQDGIPLTCANGFERIHPPQGAHAERRGIPSVLGEFGKALLCYRPLVGESLLWAGAPIPQNKQGVLARPGEPLQRNASPEQAGKEQIHTVSVGSSPRLTSAKFTGYGIVMRAAVDTPDEVSVFLQQLDKGPNDRWGFGNEGGCGDIYYYAKGRSFCGHQTEDAGDRCVTDAELTCNTGVYRDKTFRSIGMNDLTRPFYNLEVAQFAELVPRRGSDNYSWPEYVSRSVMLAGNDYIVVYDAVNGAAMSRTAWNILNGKDEMPNIIRLRGDNGFVTDFTSAGNEGTHSKRWDSSKSGGDRMMLVSHKADIKAIQPLRKRKGDPSPFVVVQTPSSRDFLFLDQKAIDYDAKELVFHGTAGLVRRRSDGVAEIALFHGTKIGTGDVVISVSDPDLGISCNYIKLPDVKGAYFGRKGGAVAVEAGQYLSPETNLFPPGSAFYVDGSRVNSSIAGQKLSAQLPPGEHRWELTAHLPEPMPPRILRTEERSGGAKIVFTPVAGAEQYRVEICRDGGANWQTSGSVATTAGEWNLSELSNGTRLYARVVALNANQESRPSREYPLCPTDAPPPHPDGLKIELAHKQAQISWGEVFGASEYRLYRREHCEQSQTRSDFKEIYRGLGTRFTDQAPDVIPAYPEPGIQANARRSIGSRVIYEYTVAAVNGNGEGLKSAVADTDPASWRNWNPPGIDLRFKRQSEFWLPAGVAPEPYP